jgi:DhnA family fructose-bisphosphate aldolase class Ia
MYHELRAIAEEAKQNGLAVVVWSYPRGSGLSKKGRPRSTSSPMRRRSRPSSART